MSETWNAINKLETLTYKVSNAADVLELIAVECTEDPTSGALWYMSESLKALVREAENDVEELYRNHLREINPPKPEKKEKKKK
jgi:hypothetical protein